MHSTSSGRNYTAGNKLGTSSVGKTPKWMIILLLLESTFAIVSTLKDDVVQYTVLEEQPIGTVVGILPILTGLSYKISVPTDLFSLNPTTGVITTKSVINRDLLPSSTLNLLIQSTPAPPQHIIQVTIIVIDVNDNIPTFPQPEISVSFVENAQVGTQVILETATDKDVGNNDVTLRYNIVSGNTASRFQLILVSNNISKPLLYLENVVVLDREDQAFYTLNISAQDGGIPPRFGFLKVNVSITDINDNPPVFDRSIYFVNLSESASVGTFVVRVSATDRDSGVNALIVYDLIDDSGGQFSINPNSGIVTTAKNLSCSNSCSGTLDPNCRPNTCVVTVEAYDRGQPYPLSSQAYISITLLDENNHSPVIHFNYQDGGPALYVDEQLQVGAVVLAISVTDQDQGMNQQTTLQITSGNELGDFRLESTSIAVLSLLKLAHSLDHTRTGRYNITFKASDMGSPPRSSYASLVLIVNSTSGTPPVFDSPSYSATLVDNSRIGSFVVAVSAQTGNTRSLIQYAINAGNDLGWFAIDTNTGLITTENRLNFKAASTVILTVQGANGNSKSYINVTITILDSLSGCPRFSYDAYFVTLTDGQGPNAEVLTVSVSSSASGIVYKLDPEVDYDYPGMFAIGKSSGQIFTLKKLNSREYSGFSIAVIAVGTQAYCLNAETKIYVNVTTKNNPPICYPLNYFVSLSSSSSGQNFLQVQASDLDVGSYGLLSYALASGSDSNFAISAANGWMSTLQPVSKLSQTVYSLAVLVQDSGGLRCQNSVNVRIMINCVPNTTVTFNQLFYSFSMVEDDGRLLTPSSGRTLGQVQATSSPQPKTLSYFIAGGDPDGTFSIRSDTGSIQTSAAVDREKKSFYNLILVALSDQCFGIVTANVTILDLNDNAPHFSTSNVDVDVDENRPIGQDVYAALAMDPDAGLNGSVRYSLTSNSSSFFTVDSISGLIKLPKLLQSRTTDTMIVYVVATDQGTPPLSSMQRVTIEINTLFNIYSVALSQSGYQIAVIESQNVNSQFFCLRNQTDFSTTFRVSYGNNDERIGIFPDGCFYVASELDRETTDMYVLTVEASLTTTAEIQTSNVEVIVVILDENDNSPAFLNSTYNYVIVEESPALNFAGLVIAYDADNGRNAEILYHLDGADHGFSVDPLTGLLTVSQVFDRELLVQQTGSDYIALTVVASDCGIIPRQTSIYVNIKIADINNKVPKFTRQVYDVTVMENASISTVLLTVEAVDLDAGLNGSVSYYILNGNENNQFQIDPVSGEIMLVRSLDSKHNQLYLLKVMAVDWGTPLSLNSTALVRVTVQSSSNGYLNWVQFPVYGVNISRYASVGESVVQITALGSNLNRNAAITYSFSATNSQFPFVIESSTGKIFLSKLLNYTKTTSYSVNVTASYSNTRLSAPVLSRSLWINVVDSNDLTPRFINDVYSYSIAEDSLLGASVFTVKAVDNALAMNVKFRYSILRQFPFVGNFTLNENTGLVTLNGSLDRKLTGQYQLVIDATNVALPRMFQIGCQQTFDIFVINAYNTTPKFMAADSIVVALSTSAGSLIASIKAIGSQKNSLITYKIYNGNTTIFSLDANSGNLYLISSLNAQIPTYNLTVQATDQYQLTSFQQLTIIIRSAFDTGPIFSQSSYTGQLLENEPQGTSIVTVSASYFNSPSSSIRYYIAGINSNGIRQPMIFQIDRRSGLISSSQPLDREAGFGVFNVDIFAVDETAKSPQVRNSQVVIALIDKNDNVPYFVSYPSQLQIPSDAVTGSILGHVRAFDRDVTGSLKYSIVSGASDGKINIDSNSGDLLLARSLDRSVTPFYSLTVGVTDGTYQAQISVLVNITEAGNSDLEFLLPIYIFDIAKNAEIGRRIGQVSSRDFASNLFTGPVTYSILSNSGSDVCNLDPVTGVISLKGNLINKVTSLYSLTVGATFNGAEAATSTVFVNVMDGNNNWPIFSASIYNCEVFENITSGNFIVQVSATDADPGVNGQLKYKIVAGDRDGTFFVNPDSGIILLVKPLDPSIQSYYILEIEATDQATDVEDRRSVSTLVSIAVKDVNNNPPKFLTLPSLSVSEDTPVGRSIFRIVAKDSDIVNDTITYTLLSAQNVFQVGSSDGVLTLVSQLNRENKDNYLISVLATDVVYPSLSTSILMTISVEGTNDNNPVFDQSSYSVTVSENAKTGTTLLTVKATDADTGLNAELRFIVSSGDDVENFLLDSYTGELAVRWNLNYERKSSYKLIVVAHDLGMPQRSSSTTVSVTVTDVHDFTPVFVDSPYTFYAYEEMTATNPILIGQLSATDLDSPAYSRLSYSIPEPAVSFPFYVNSSGSLICTQTLNREIMPTYVFSVVAVDSGFPALVGTATVTVMVADANDYSPIFDHGNYVGRVAENSPPGTPVLQVHADDEDEGIGAEIWYSLVDDGSASFSVDKKTGLISTAKQLDWEFRDSYSMVVIATDHGWIPHSGSASVLVTVLDLNDHVPQFLRSSYSVQIQDPTSTGSFVAGITALDPDKGNNGSVVYSLNNGSSFFDLNVANGVILAKKSLSSASGTTTFSVRASDMGQPPRYNDTMVTVSFLPALSSGFPSFTNTLRTFNIYENVPLGYTLTTVLAVSTKGSGITIFYSVAGGNVDGWFEIDNQGKVTVQKVPDYERASSVTLWLEAKDNSSSPALSSFVNLSIAIVDVNEHAPDFVQTFYNASIYEGLPPQTFVVDISAVDSDSGENGRVTYSLSPNNDSRYFAIDANNGNITTSVSLNWEISPIYKLIVLASDHGSPSLTSSTTVDIHVLNSNNHPPIFTQLFSASIRENSPIGSYVLTVTSTSANANPNAGITYSLVSNPQNSFSINDTTGILSTKEVLDYELQTEYVLRVSARNQAYNTETSITVDVIDENDYAPFCGQPIYNFETVATSVSGILVGNVSAIDQDATNPNRDTFFRIQYPSHSIRVNASSVYLRSAAWVLLAGETLSPLNSIYSVITAVDRGMPPRSSDCQAFVKILAENVFAPVFQRSSYRAAVPTNAGNGFVVMQLVASDNDSYPPNSIINYILENGTNLFNLDPQTGVLSLNGVLLFNTTVSILARDNGIPSRSTKTYVSVYLVPSNLYVPQFVGISQVEIPEDETVGSVVARVTATYSDVAMDNGYISYFISSGNEGVFFTIDANLGTIKLVRPLDYELQDLYRLEITARDHQMSPQDASTYFTITITDLNDNAPTFDRTLYEGSILETVAMGTVVIVTNVSDADSGQFAAISYRLIGDSSTLAKFSIRKDGTIVTTGTFSFREKSQFNFSVVASNPGSSMSSSSNVIISVIAVNPNPPQFERKEYDFSISNKVSPGTWVGTIHALDSDFGSFGVVEYQLVADGNQNGFALDQNSGSITVSDFSLVPTSGQAVLTALAKNPGPIHDNKFDICTILVSVIGSEKHVVFTPSSYQVTVNESTQIGTNLIRISATIVGQSLVGLNMSYSIAGGNTGSPFSIDLHTGWLSISGKLNHSITPVYNLTIVASSSGSSASTYVTIVVLSGKGDDSANYQCLTTAPCKNGGSCLKSGSGYSCQCPFSSRGFDCGVGSLGFPLLSYAQYDLVLGSGSNLVALELATVMNNALVLYYSADQRSFMAVEIIAGQVRLSLAGVDSVVKRVTNSKSVSDGLWHRIEASRDNNMMIVLKVTDCNTSVATCDACVNENSNCYSTLNAATMTSLETSNPFFTIGGIKDIQVLLAHPGRVSTNDFSGCLRNVTVDTYDLFSMASSLTNLTTSTCPRMQTSLCRSNMCQNGGSCVDEWTGVSCRCLPGFWGETCSNVSSVISLGPGSVVIFHQTEQYRRDQLLAQSMAKRRKRGAAGSSQAIQINVQTKNSTGILFYFESSDGSTLISINGGKVMYRSDSPTYGSEQMDNEISVSDLSWHNISFFVNGFVVNLTVDKTVQTATFNHPLHDPLGPNVTTIVLGGKIPSNVNVGGFSGCLDNFMIGGQKVPLGGATDRFEIEQIGSVLSVCHLEPVIAIPASTTQPTAAWQVPVIIVAVILGVILVFLVILFLLLFRRRQQKKSRKDKIQNGEVEMSSSEKKLKNVMPDPRDLQMESNTNILSDRSPRHSNSVILSGRPDVVVPELHPRGSGSWSDEGCDNMGYSLEIPERYDLDNASSIAPSDLADVVAHYKRYRNGTLRNGDIPKMNPGTHAVSTRELALHEMKQLQLMQRQNSPTKQLARQSPSNGLDKPGLRTASSAKRQPNSIRSTPLSGISEIYPSSGGSSSSYAARRPGLTELKPISQRNTPTVGLTLEEVNRLSNSNRCTPSNVPLDTISSSSEHDVQNVINMTDFTHDDLKKASALVPSDSSSDEDDRNDTFTCSEFEIDPDRTKRDFSNPNRLILAPLATRNKRNRDGARSRKSPHDIPFSDTTSEMTKDDAFSAVVPSEDLQLSCSDQPSEKLVSDALDWNYLLNWEANISSLVGVFNDLSNLPDASHGRSRDRTPRSSVSPLSHDWTNSPINRDPRASKSPNELHNRGPHSSPSPRNFENYSQIPPNNLQSRHSPYQKTSSISPGLQDRWTPRNTASPHSHLSSPSGRPPSVPYPLEIISDGQNRRNPAFGANSPNKINNTSEEYV